MAHSLPLMRALPDAGGLPGIGHLPAMLSDPLTTLNRLESRLGPVFRTRLLRDAVVLLGPDANARVLQNRDGEFSSAGGWGWFIDPVFPGAVMSMDDPAHRFQRRIMQAAFKKQALVRYLINQFIAARTNHRDDAWGGSYEKRMRFPVEIVRRVRERVGPNFIIIFRLSMLDLVEGATLNTQRWTSTTATMTITQAATTGILFNASAITTINTGAMLTSRVQHPYVTMGPMHFRARLRSTAVANQEWFAGLSFQGTLSSTAVVDQGAFWKFGTDGTIKPALWYAAAEVSLGTDVAASIASASPRIPTCSIRRWRGLMWGASCSHRSAISCSRSTRSWPRSTRSAPTARAGA